MSTTVEPTECSERREFAPVQTERARPAVTDPERLATWLLMKSIFALFGILTTVLTTSAQETLRFEARLSPVTPTATNSWINSTARLELDGYLVNYSAEISFEEFLPVNCSLDGAGTSVTFAMNWADMTIHRPGRVPGPGYDGVTYFRGSFTLPDLMKQELVTGKTTLTLRPPGRYGDFQGLVLPIPEPSTGVLTIVGLTVIATYNKRRTLELSAAEPAARGNAE